MNERPGQNYDFSKGARWAVIILLIGIVIVAIVSSFYPDLEQPAADTDNNMATQSTTPVQRIYDGKCQ